MYPSVQPGSADCYVEVEYPAITVSSIYAGLLPFVLRADSFEVSNGATNWQGFRVHVGRNRSTQSVLQLVRLTHTTTADAGAATTLFSQNVNNTAHTVRLEAVGSQIRLYLDGIQKYSLSDAQNQNVIGCGLRASGSTDATSNFLTRYEHGNM
jgi:hypothetical protein